MYDVCIVYGQNVALSLLATLQGMCYLNSGPDAP